MQKKLTLTIKEQTIQRAKYYAKQTGRSLSDIVESYLDRITNANQMDTDEELDKIFGIIELPENFDEKNEIRKILTEKYDV